jgi:hypothetical protein
LPRDEERIVYRSAGLNWRAQRFDWARWNTR